MTFNFRLNLQRLRQTFQELKADLAQIEYFSNMAPTMSGPTKRAERVSPCGLRPKQRPSFGPV